MLKHWIWLTLRKGIGHVGCKKLLSAFGSAEEIFAMTPTQIENLKIKGMKSTWVSALADKDLTEAEQIVRDCERYNINIITFNDSAYPDRLKEIYDPPCVLYYKGTLPYMDQEVAVGVVGTRRCTNYGLLQTKQLATLISLSGGVVISGGARGIDTMALYGALNSYMPVVCVLAGGLDQYYPSENKKLFEEITKQGCLISEIPPGGRPVPKYFVARNRLISGLSNAILVVEAPKGSGAMTTAELALSQNRDVFTVRRQDSGYYNQGNEELINAGCEVVRDGWDLMSRYASQHPDRVRDGRGREAMQLQYNRQMGGSMFVLRSPSAHPAESILQEPISEPAPTVQTETPAPVKPRSTKSRKKTPDTTVQEIPSDLPEPEGKVLSVFGRDPMELDEIILKSGMGATAVTTALTMLQIKKRIIKCYGNSYQRI